MLQYNSEVVGVASEEVRLVVAPQASVAVAEPRAAVIAAEVGLHPKSIVVVPVAVMLVA